MGTKGDSRLSQWSRQTRERRRDVNNEKIFTEWLDKCKVEMDKGDGSVKTVHRFLACAI